MKRAVSLLCVCAVCMGFLCSCRVSPLMEAEYENDNNSGLNTVVVLKSDNSDTEEDRDFDIQDGSVRAVIVEVPEEPEEPVVETAEETEEQEEPEVPEEPVVSEEPEQEQEPVIQVVIPEEIQETVVQEEQPPEEPVQSYEPVQLIVQEPQAGFQQASAEETAVQEPVYTYTDFIALKRTVCALNVRSGPSVGYDRIDTLAENEIVTVTGQCNETGWFRIERNGYVGYCSPDYLADVAEQAEDNSAQNTESVQQVLNSDQSVQNTDNSNNGGNNTAQQTQNTQTEVTRLSCDYVVTEGDVSTAMYNHAVNTYNDLPSWVKTMFQDAGWVVCVSALDFAGRYGFSGIGGLTVYADKTIFVCDDDGCTSRDCIWHEMGHFVDYQIGCERGGRPSNTDEWADIMKAEGQTMKDYFNWYISSITEHEYYAEATYFYWDRPSELQKVASRTYAYLNNIYAGR